MNAPNRPPEPSGTDRRFARRGFLAGVAGVSAGAIVARRTHRRPRRSHRRGPPRSSAPRHVPHQQGPTGRGPVRHDVQEAPTVRAARRPAARASPERWSRTRRSPTTAISTPAHGSSRDSRSSASSSTTTSPSTTRRSLSSRRTPTRRINFRTPRYDLDSVYGRGPATEPQFYDPADRDKLLVTPNVNGVQDVPRDSNGRAVIPEARNDENLIIVQLHKAIAQFHNRIVDHARAQGIRREWVFETARRLTRWHYQWAVTHDFLPRFVGDALVGPSGTVYKEIAGKSPVITLNYYRPTNKDGRPFMPVEFAVAAYRFGHSIIRPFYVINQSTLGPRGRPGLRPGRRLQPQRWPPHPRRPGHGVEEHPSRRPELPGTEATQDRHQAVAAAHHAPRLRRPAPGPDDPSRRSQLAPRQARRAPVRTAGRPSDARSRSSPTQPSASTTIRAGPARHRSGTTS